MTYVRIPAITGTASQLASARMAEPTAAAGWRIRHAVELSSLRDPEEDSRSPATVPTEAASSLGELSVVPTPASARSQQTRERPPNARENKQERPSARHCAISVRTMEHEGIRPVHPCVYDQRCKPPYLVNTVQCLTLRGYPVCSQPRPVHKRELLAEPDFPQEALRLLARGHVERYSLVFPTQIAPHQQEVMCWK